MTVTRRSYVGTASSTRLATAIGISDTTLTVTSGGGAGYPTGVNPFVIVVDYQIGSEEKILCSSRTADTFTVAVSGRGFDGTTAQAHSSGAVVVHSISAVDMDQVNQHGADTTQDDHSQYLNVARHDITARHAYGSALTSPAAATTAASSTTTSQSYANLVDGVNTQVSVTIAASGVALVMIKADMLQSVSGNGSWVGFAVSGTSTVAASDGSALVQGIAPGSGLPTLTASGAFLVSGLTSGSGNIFTLKYRVATGDTLTASNRSIIVWPL